MLAHTQQRKLQNKAMMLKEPFTKCFKLFLSSLLFTVDKTQFSRLHENFSSFSINVQRALDAYFCFDGFLMHFNGAWKFREVEQSRKVFFQFQKFKTHEENIWRSIFYKICWFVGKIWCLINVAPTFFCHCSNILIYIYRCLFSCSASFACKKKVSLK